jgi:hypothetical protein
MQAAPRGHRLPMAKTSLAAAVAGRRTSISGCASDWRRPNRHSCGRPSTSCGMPRGFLPWGLSNTCPQDDAMRASVACDGQVSDNPKQVLSLATGGFRVVQQSGGPLRPADDRKVPHAPVVGLQALVSKRALFTARLSSRRGFRSSAPHQRLDAACDRAEGVSRPFRPAFGVKSMLTPPAGIDFTREVETS